ncbi:caspase family protein [Rhizobium leguminosarum]|uniref:caspase family protein n=1 Tax=Rhizobium leguminosarum TaxID=384 RepID=UPI001C90F76C|nr:caspase family protein [Rhizobium leguminosarum]MBY2937936.1 hypothetical protein [Rhizobium leguminosarum]
MKLDANDPGRQFGLVYRDDARAGSPAAHVLVIGVGAYQSPTIRPLTSTTVSARAVADWFMDKAGFNNPDRPLGSVAVLLSEPIGDEKKGKSQYAGGEVPRADSASAKAAVREWVKRLNTNPGNLVFLYLASHGESFLNRTAFLLEDFGTDPFNVTGGACEVEQLLGALSFASPSSQLLLFDCCRSPTDLHLPWPEQFGDKLISLGSRDGNYATATQQWAINATSLGEVALGRTNDTTLFADALLAALRGVAGDPSSEGWPVRPGTLVDKIDKLMSLHRMPDERTQTPGGRLAGTFDITYPGETADVPVYISLDDSSAWPDAVITVTETPGAASTIIGRDDEAPYKLIRVPLATALAVQAKCVDAPFGSAQAKAYAPANFMQIRRAPPPAPQVVGQLDASRSIGDAAQLVINVEGPTQIQAGGIADIIRRDDPAKNPKQIAVPIGGKTTVDVSAGALLISLRTPNGVLQSRDCDVEKGQVLEVRFTLPDSPHEWLATAAMTGSIREAPAPQEIPRVLLPAPAVAPTSGTRTFARDAFWRVRSRLEKETSPVLPAPSLDEVAKQGMEARDNLIFSNVSYNVEIAGPLRLTVPANPMLDIGELQDDGRLVRLDVIDGSYPRYASYAVDAVAPLFALVNGAGRQELVAIPSLGHSTDHIEGGWRPYILADRLAPFDQALCRVVVDDAIWGALLGFLASRDMEASGRLLDGGLRKAAIQAMREKVGNPLAALAGALVAVGSDQLDVDQRWDPWLHNLSNWFPGIPDGPIILGRRLLTRAKNQNEVAAAKAWLLEGFKRGAPLYSLSVDWLARDLEALPDDDDEMTRMRTAARRLASLTDPTQAFTVIRFDFEGRQ